MNFFNATNDIAVDGLAVEWLKNDEIGWGNSAQVAGFKIGMLTGGGILVWLTSFVDWSGIFISMACLVLLVLLLIIPLDFDSFNSPHTTTSPSPTSTPTTTPSPTAPTAPTTRKEKKEKEGEGANQSPSRSHKNPLLSFLLNQFQGKSIDQQEIKAFFDSLSAPSSLQLLLVIATYKMGESVIDTMWKPFLVDCGLSLPTIGLWTGVFGMIFSISGSIAGGWLCKTTISSAVKIASIFRVFPLLAKWYLTFFLGKEMPTNFIFYVICAEEFFGGMLTTCIFSLMMSQVHKKLGSTHFTLFSCVEILGKSLSSSLSGLLTDFVGYSSSFGLGCLISIGFVGLVTWEPKKKEI
eukprot:TRINITY_DN1466_c0_g1_i4.p1 TRINITY_DN1466_c0_g1~~TRINITY_DN1466_c0_g1_i4.p1  ORF type:complete len:351 (-),score=122.54 TRINITY_DN1466_c0_g1_i4:136-1188(-)